MLEIQIYTRTVEKNLDKQTYMHLRSETGIHTLDFYAPYMKVTKREILQDGAKCCEQLGLNFDEVYKRTNTSYDPDPVTGKSSGKSGADIERILAFHSLGLIDPVEYVEGWEKSLEFALQAERDFLAKK